MGLLDREWFREARSQNDGPPPTDRNLAKRSDKKRRPIDPEDLTKANNVPPAHAVLAARYEVAIRARTKKTFAKGYLCGIATCALIFLFIYLQKH